MSLLKMEVINANVERQMKILGAVITPKRNNIGVTKVNEEMIIKYNLKKYENFVNDLNFSQEINPGQSTNQIVKSSRKTKLVQLIVDNTEYLPKKRLKYQ